MENTVNKIIAYFWLALGIIGLIGVIFKGAWWHIPTAAVCFILFLSMLPKEAASKISSR